MQRLKQHRDSLLATLIYFVWTIIATFPVALQARDHITEFGDPLLNIWIIRWNQYALRNFGSVDFFDANVFYPFTDALAYSENLTFTAILFWPLNLLTDNAILTYNWILLLSYFFTALTAYALARELKPNAFWGAIITGGIFAFANYRMGQIARLQYVTAYLLPLTMLFAIRMGRKSNWRDAILLGCSVGLQFWTNIYYAFFSAPMLILFGAFYAAGNWKKIRPKLFLQAAAAGAIAIALVVPSIESYLRAGELLGRRPVDSQSGAFIQSYFALLSRNTLLGRIWPDALSDGPYIFFPGFIAIALVFIYLRYNRQRTWLDYFWPTLAIFMLILSFGTTLRLAPQVTLLEWMPYRFLFDRVSLLSALRVPARFVAVVMLAIAVMAGQGLTLWLDRPNAKRGAALVVLFLIGAEYLSFPHPMKFVHAANQINPVYTWLGQQPPNSPYLELPSAKSTDITGELITIERLTMQQYHSIYHWQPSIMGYSGGVPLQYGATVEISHQFPDPDSIAYLHGLGVKYIVVHFDQLTPSEQHTIREGAAALSDQITAVQTFGDSQVYELDPPQVDDVRVSLENAQQGDTHFLYLVLHTAGDYTANALGTPDFELLIEWDNGQQQQLTGTSPTLIPASGLQIPVPLQVPAGAQTAQITLDIVHQRIESTLTLSADAEAPELGGVFKTFERNPDRSTYLLHAHLPHGTTYLAGSSVRAHLDWQGMQPFNLIFGYVHLLDAQGNKWSQQDVRMFPNQFGSASYKHIVDLPRDLPPGDYALVAGAYLDLDDQTRVELGQITVEQPDKRLVQHATPFQLGDSIDLLGYDLNEACDTVNVTLYWQKSAEIPNQTAFLHLVDANGQLISQSDSVPRSGTHPVSSWQIGETVLDNHRLSNDELGLSTFQLYVGMYDSESQQNLPIYQDGAQVSADRILLGTVDRSSCNLSE